ncbi:hypothetical protein HD806DRAFT_510402 [Xylariaceae sp. AK1471]|nr:hypothetical protein HD806DRAFT_510402 [Xylariaceae sp. AK1471]
MGNASSVASALSTHTLTYSTPLLSETRRSFSVTPFEHSTFVSVTKSSSKSSSYGPSPTRTGEHCTWDYESDSLSCSFWSWSVDVPTAFSVPAPTGGYETSEASYSFTQAEYTCTDFICINSVASSYGYSLCVPTSEFGFPTETYTWPDNSYTTEDWPVTTPTCDPVFDWEECPWTSLESSILDSFTAVWPTETWDTDIWPTETTPDCDTIASTAVSGPNTVDCGFDIDCWTSLDFTIPESWPTPFATITKHSYSYHTTSIRRTSTSITSDCDFWDDDCTPAATSEPTS